MSGLLPPALFAVPLSLFLVSQHSVVLPLGLSCPKVTQLWKVGLTVPFGARTVGLTTTLGASGSWLQLLILGRTVTFGLSCLP